MNCDICGKSAILRKALVENVMLNVCDRCINYGKEIEEKKEVIKQIVSKPEVIVEILVPDYADRVKTRREEMKLNQKQLAFEINEKESVIHLIETNKLEPTVDTAKKLEKFLKVVLLVKQEDNFDKKINFKDRSLTVGDLIKLRDDKV